MAKVSGSVQGAEKLVTGAKAPEDCQKISTDLCLIFLSPFSRLKRYNNLAWK